MDKFAIYYGARMFFCQFLYGLLFSVASVVVAFVLSFIIGVVMDHGIPSDINQSPGMGFAFYVYFVIFCFLCMVILTYFNIKLSLKKMFFKPYKKFVITTEIERITPKMVFIFWGMEFLLTFIVEFVIELMFLKDLTQNLESTGNIAKYIFVLSSVGLIVGFCVNYVVSKYFVHKYATVTFKQPSSQ